MKVRSCAATQRRLQALHDGELPIAEQLAVNAHLEWCEECASTLTELRLLRLVLRASRPATWAVSNDEALSFIGGVVNRAKAEERLSLRTRVRELFTDMHFVYAGLGAAVAAIICVVVMLSMMRLASTESPESLAALVRIVGSPGSNENPLAVSARVSLPRALDDSFASPPVNADDAAFTLLGVVTREGTVQNLELLATTVARTEPLDAREIQLVGDLLGAVSRSRFEPASRAGLPVAVNMVWIVAHTTVRGNQNVGDETQVTGVIDHSVWLRPQGERRPASPVWA